MKNKALPLAILLLSLIAGYAKAQDPTPLLSQDFEPGTEKVGWTFNGTEIEGLNTGYGYIISNINHTEGGNCSFRFQNNSNAYGYLVSPELTGAVNNGVRVNFYYTNYFKGVSSEFKVGYSTTTNNQFIWGDVVSAYNGTMEDGSGEEGWTLYDNVFPADVKFVAIASMINGHILYVDDIVLTESDCSMPSIPWVTHVSDTVVSLGWLGEADTLRSATLDMYDFEDEAWGGWEMRGDSSWWWSGDDAQGHNSSHCVLSNGSALSEYNYLVSPEIELGGSITFYAMGVPAEGGLRGRQNRDNNQLSFKVMVSSGDSEVFEGASDVFDASDAGWVRYTVDLSAYSGMGHVAICHICDRFDDPGDEDSYYLAIDDVTVCSPWSEVSEGVAGANHFTIDGLSPETQYAIQLKGECQWGDRSYVKTLPSGGISLYRFVRNGLWDEASNWYNGYIPGMGDAVRIEASARIPANYVAKAGNITIQSGSITIADGGQLMHSSTQVSATMEKKIVKYTGENDNYKLLAFPTASALPINSNFAPQNYPQHLNYDFYQFDQEGDDDGNEWINYKVPELNPNPLDPGAISDYHPFTKLYNGIGYLYGNRIGRTFAFDIGKLQSSDVDVTVDLAYSDGKSFAGWNLVGNPFPCNAHLIGNRPFYRLVETDEGSRIVLAESNVIAPLEGVFVKASTSGETVTFSATEPNREGLMDFTLRKAGTRRGVKLDRARVGFGEGQNMTRLDIMADGNRIYFPLDGKAMSVVYSQPVGEMPLNIEAAANGTFVLGFTNKAENLVYCHLIDNMTGADVDLLQEPEYTFESRTTDYASRFRVVFATNSESDDDNETFAFNSNGTWIVINEGQSTLQVVDMMGRMLSSESIDGSSTISLNQSAGIYLLRLINGNDVKVQKVVVR